MMSASSEARLRAFSRDVHSGSSRILHGFFVRKERIQKV